VIVLFSMFLCSAVQADSLSGVSVITTSGVYGDGTLSMTSLTFDGTTYDITAGDLVNGTTTRFDTAGNAVDESLEVYDLKIASNADNFRLSYISNYKSSVQPNISSIDNLGYQETIFPFLVSTMFVFENGANDNGTVQAILADGSLGDALTLNSGSYGSTGVSTNQPVGGYGLTTDVPVMGLRITAPGHDALSVSAPVPEPTAMALLALGSLGVIRRRNR